MPGFQDTRTRIERLREKKGERIEGLREEIRDTERLYEDLVHAELKGSEGVQDVILEDDYGRNAVNTEEENLAFRGKNNYIDAERTQLDKVYMDSLNGLRGSESALVKHSVLDGAHILKKSEYPFILDTEGYGTSLLRDAKRPVIVKSGLEGVNLLKNAEDPLLINTEYESKTADDIPVHHVGEEVLEDLYEIAENYQGPEAYEQVREII